MTSAIEASRIILNNKNHFDTKWGAEYNLYVWSWEDGELSILCMGGGINPTGEAVVLTKEDARKLRDFLNDSLKGE